MGNVRLTWDLSYAEVFAFLHRGNFIGYFPMANGRHRVVIAYAPDQAPRGGRHAGRDSAGYPDLWSGGNASVSSRPTSPAFTSISAGPNTIKSREYFWRGTPRTFIRRSAPQGMNPASRTHLNLGWKLALAVKGQASARLLESFACGTPARRRRPCCAQPISRLTWHSRGIRSCWRSVIPHASPLRVASGGGSSAGGIPGRDECGLF